MEGNESGVKKDEFLNLNFVQRSMEAGLWFLVRHSSGPLNFCKYFALHFLPYTLLNYRFGPIILQI